MLLKNIREQFKITTTTYIDKYSNMCVMVYLTEIERKYGRSYSVYCIHTKRIYKQRVQQIQFFFSLKPQILRLAKSFHSFSHI